MPIHRQRMCMGSRSMLETKMRLHEKRRVSTRGIEDAQSVLARSVPTFVGGRLSVVRGGNCAHLPPTRSQRGVDVISARIRRAPPRALS